MDRVKGEISLKVSTSGKHIARKLRDMGFFLYLADPSKLPLKFNTGKKNDGGIHTSLDIVNFRLIDSDGTRRTLSATLPLS